MAVTYNLISQDEASYPSIFGVTYATASPFENQVVYTTDATQTYVLKKQVQCFFHQPNNSEWIKGNTINETTIVTSLLWGTTEQIVTPEQLVLLYAGWNWYLTTLYSAVSKLESEVSLPCTNNTTDNLVEFLNTVFVSKNIPLKAKMFYGLSTLDSIAILASEDDGFSFSFTSSGGDYVFGLEDGIASWDVNGSTRYSSAPSNSYVEYSNVQVFTSESETALTLAEPFQANLRDSNGVLAISVNSYNLIIRDYSNYDTNEEIQHQRAKFSEFRKIKIVSTSGLYLFSSLNDGNNIILSADQFSNTPNETVFDYHIFNGGVLTITLYILPKFNSEYHAIDDCIYLIDNGKVYKALEITNESPLTAPTKWSEVLDLDLLPSKFRAREIIPIPELKNKFVETSVLNFVCEFLKSKTVCLDICNNVNAINAYKGMLWDFAKTSLLNAGQVEMEREISNYNKQLIKCNKSLTSCQ